MKLGFIPVSEKPCAFRSVHSTGQRYGSRSQLLLQPYFLKNYLLEKSKLSMDIFAEPNGLYIGPRNLIRGCIYVNAP
ncbi:hypothetical protein HanIR_Chr16g0791421 [Helianthus annuus]|nr:hypothetical protein HanIR_Chr16g0791421 [Helianthus annuus]